MEKMRRGEQKLNYIHYNEKFKKYRVGITFDEGQTIEVSASNTEEAEELALQLVEEYGGTDYPEKYKQDFLHRDWSIANIYEAE